MTLFQESQGFLPKKLKRCDQRIIRPDLSSENNVAEHRSQCNRFLPLFPMISFWQTLSFHIEISQSRKPNMLFSKSNADIGSQDGFRFGKDIDTLKRHMKIRLFEHGSYPAVKKIDLIVNDKTFCAFKTLGRSFAGVLPVP